MDPGAIPSPDSCFVVGYVAKREAREFSRGQLNDRGFIEGRDFLMAA